MLAYEPSSLAANQRFLDHYVEGISIPYDDFLEEHILSSAIYSIVLNGNHSGFFGRQGKMVTIFVVDDLNFPQAGAILADIKMQFDIREAFVPTTDLSFLSVVLEQYAGVEIQALHFTDTKTAVRPPEFPRDNFRLATEKDLKAVCELAGDFLDRYAERISHKELYVLEEEGALIGLGVLVANKIMKNCIGTGMFTKESRRGEGIGRSIILHLKAIVLALGKTPVPGCWYYNTNSRKTLESAGYVSKSKLLKFQF